MQNGDASKMFFDALEKTEKDIRSGTLSETNLLSLPFPLLLFNQGKLLKLFAKQKTLTVHEFYNLTEAATKQNARRYPTNSASEYFFDDPSFVDYYLGHQPAFPTPRIFHTWRAVIEKYMLKNIAYALAVYEALPSAECFNIIKASKKHREYLKKETDYLFEVFKRIVREEVLDLFCPGKLQELLKNKPAIAFDLFIQTRSKRFLSHIQKNDLIAYLNANVHPAVEGFQQTNIEDILDLPIKDALCRYSTEKPEFFFLTLRFTNSKKLFHLIDRDSLRTIVLAGKYERIFPLVLNEEILQELGVGSLEDHRERIFLFYTDTVMNTLILMCAKGANEAEIGIDLTEEDRTTITHSFLPILRCYTSIPRMYPPEKKCCPRTIGAELEVFNQDKTGEIIIPPVPAEHILLVIKFLSDLSILFYQKVDAIRKNTPKKFPGYPHMDVHFNFSLTKREEENARLYDASLENLSYAYALAYMPYPRIVYLEKNDGSTQTGYSRQNTIDKDIQYIHPAMSSRYQIRFFSIGGSKEEIIASLRGIGVVLPMFSTIFDDIAKLRYIDSYLDETSAIHDCIFKLKWVMRHINELSKERSAHELLVSVFTVSKSEFEEKNIRLRREFIIVQKELRALLRSGIEEKIEKLPS